MQRSNNNVVTSENSAIGSDKRHGAMILDYIDSCLCVFNTVVIADLFFRFYKVLREHFFYKNNYVPAGRLGCIAKRALTYNAASQIFLLVGFAGTILRYGVSVRFLQDMRLFVPFIPLYWIYCAVDLSHSTLSYTDFVRESHGLDYGAGMASNYYHGYLKLTMPSYTAHPGIRQRIELYSAAHNVTFAVNRLIILIPNTLFVNSTIESKILEKAAPLEAIMKNRAGVNRPFKNDVYRFTVPINGKFYYLALEGATPLLSFFEAMHHEPSTTWQMKEMQREILFKFYRHLKKLLKWPETQHEVELVFYNAIRSDGRLQDVGDVLLAHVTHLWNEEANNR